jgi:CxxC motif-containing protein
MQAHSADRCRDNNLYAKLLKAYASCLQVQRLVCVGVFTVLDQILSWMLIILQVAFGFILILVPAKQEDLKRHMRWRYALGGLLIAFGVFTWIQQSRALKASIADREKAITETSERVSIKVAADTSASVTKTVTELYSQMIAQQKSQISDLQAQVKAQGSDVKAIKGSDFISGKNPIKVEVTNGLPSAPTSAQVENMRMSWDVETSIHNDAPYAKKVTIQVDAPVNPIKFAIVCDAPIKYGDVKIADEGGVYYGGNEIYKNDAHIYVINMTGQGAALLRPDAPLVVHLYSDHPFNIVRGERGPR